MSSFPGRSGCEIFQDGPVMPTEGRSDVIGHRLSSFLREEPYFEFRAASLNRIRSDRISTGSCLSPDACAQNEVSPTGGNILGIIRPNSLQSTGPETIALPIHPSKAPMTVSLRKRSTGRWGGAYRFMGRKSTASTTQNLVGTMYVAREPAAEKRPFLTYSDTLTAFRLALHHPCP